MYSRCKKTKFLKNIKRIIVLSLFIVLSVFILKKIFIGKSLVPIDNVASMKISYETLNELRNLSDKYEIQFSELLTYYMLYNNFFDSKSYINDRIEQNFIINYDSIKSSFRKKDVTPYYKLIDSILDEIKVFPISSEYASDYIYGDSWGIERTYGGKRIHKGCDIMDRENIRGRIPIVSMTDGIVENLGWNEKGGYRVGIRSENGNYYYYAHFDKYSDNISKGKSVLCGDIIGYMGDTGYSKNEGTKGNFPVHLHVGISPYTELSSEEFWINPYPFLRMVEKEE